MIVIQVYLLENQSRNIYYLEAAGYVLCMKAGIIPESVRV